MMAFNLIMVSGWFITYIYQGDLELTKICLPVSWILGSREYTTMLGSNILCSRRVQPILKLHGRGVTWPLFFSFLLLLVAVPMLYVKIGPVLVTGVLLLLLAGNQSGDAPWVPVSTSRVHSSFPAITPSTCSFPMIWVVGLGCPGSMLRQLMLTALA